MTKNGYAYTKQWFDFAQANFEKIKPVDGILYLYCVELNNSLKWAEKFGLPAYNTMKIIGVRDYKTYKKAFNNLEKWGLIKVIERSKNQWTSTIIALVFFTKAHPKAHPLYINNTKPYKTDGNEKRKINVLTDETI